jgi:hypothetical protein
MRHRWVIPLATCAMVLTASAAHAYNETSWQGMGEALVLLAVSALVAAAVVAALVVLVIWATRRVERLRAAAEPLTAIDYLLWGAIGAAPGGWVGAVLGIQMAMHGGPPFTDSGTRVCVSIVAGAVVGVGIAIWRVRRRYDSGCSRAAQLAGYAAQCRKQGQDDESIAQTLRGSGWDEESIGKALGSHG